MASIPLSMLWERLEPGDWVIYTESGDARQRWILDSMFHTLASRGYRLILLEHTGICEKDPPGFLNVYRLNASKWDLPLFEALEHILREHASPAVILAEGLAEWLHEAPSRWALVERLRQGAPALWIVIARDQPGRPDPVWMFDPSAQLVLMPASGSPSTPVIAWVRRAIGSLAPGFYRAHPPPAARLEPLFLSSQHLEAMGGAESHHQGERASINPPADPSPQKNRGLEQHLALIRQILTRAQEATDLPSFLNALIRELVERLGFDRGAITMLREGVLEIIAEHRAHGGPSALRERISLQDDPLSATIIATGRPLVLSDVRNGAPFGSSKPLIQRLRIRSTIIVPLIARGQVIGTIGLDAVKQPRSFDEAEVELIQTIAAAVAGFIERMQWLEEAQRRARVLETLRSILHEALASAEPRRFMEGVLMHICTAFDLPFGAIWIGEQIVTHGISTDQLAFVLKASREASYRLHAVDSIPDCAAMPPSPLRNALLQLGIRATLSAPIYSEGQPIGGLAVSRPRPHFWSAEERALLEMAAEEIGLVIARIQAYQSLRIFYALSDALSSLQHPEPALGNALEAFRIHLNASRICIYTPDPERSGQLIAWVCAGMPSISPTDQVRWEGPLWIRQALQRGELWLEDCRAQLPEAPDQALALLPLQANETFLGLLEIAWATPRVFDESLRVMVKRAASILASGMLNVGLWKELQERVRQLEALNRALEQALVAREQMIQNVSHELRTPLAVIQGYLELMDQEALGPLTSDQRQALGVMRERLNVLIRYVELLLALQEIRAGARSLSFLDLRQLTQMACRVYRTRIDPQRHSLHVYMPDHPVWVLGESQLLLLAFSELLENAVKFSPHGGAIDVSLQVQGDEACLQVRDEGVGIPPEALPRVFEPFYQVDGSTTRKFGGMGIGLTAVKQIAEAHGGRVEIRSELGRGTCVSLWLPIVRT
ncbi:GAF domain-containing protein [Thermoflexus sp.]|uniref:GAF domain-containing protein n=1 Tax=Thermoflexus sp. TaxID=1969742 RepID=UPI0035E4372B